MPIIERKGTPYGAHHHGRLPRRAAELRRASTLMTCTMCARPHRPAGPASPEFGLPERVRPTGSSHQPLDEDAGSTAGSSGAAPIGSGRWASPCCSASSARGVERRVRRQILEELAGLSVSLSYEVRRRSAENSSGHSTTVVRLRVEPGRYLGQLEANASNGPASAAQYVIMLSSGAVVGGDGDRCHPDDARCVDQSPSVGAGAAAARSRVGRRIAETCSPSTWAAPPPRPA